VLLVGVLKLFVEISADPSPWHKVNLRMRLSTFFARVCVVKEQCRLRIAMYRQREHFLHVGLRL